MRTQISRKKTRDSAPVTRQSVKRELAWASGSEYFQNRDPLYHVNEQFQMTFDRVGMEHARRLAEESGSGFSEEERREQSQPLSGRENQPGRGERVFRSPAGAEKMLPGSQVPMETFARTAFQRGELSGAVLAGTGKMMLVSCLKRTVGQSGPMIQGQETLFGTGSQRRNIPGHDPDMVQFNRNVTDSAVGLVVDVLRDARRTVQSMEDLADGCGELEQGEGGTTLRAMYPFLDDRRERELAETYRARLADTDDPRQVPVLQNALVHTQALIQKKAQMKQEFINKLRQISQRAEQFLEELSQPEVGAEIAAALLQPEPDWPEPPEDEGGWPPDDTDQSAQWGTAPDQPGTEPGEPESAADAGGDAADGLPGSDGAQFGDGAGPASDPDGAGAP